MARRGQDASNKMKRGSGEREAYWRRALAEWSGSRVSKVAFCRKRGLSPSAFHWWKGELARRDAGKGSRPASPCSVKGTGSGTKGRPGFVAVRVAEGAAEGAAVPPRANGQVEGALEVVLGNGRRVRVGLGFDAEVLVRVVGVLEGMPC